MQSTAPAVGPLCTALQKRSPQTARNTIQIDILYSFPQQNRALLLSALNSVAGLSPLQSMKLRYFADWSRIDAGVSALQGPSRGVGSARGACPVAAPIHDGLFDQEQGRVKEECRTIELQESGAYLKLLASVPK
jgi:hypothetical protein